MTSSPPGSTPADESPLSHNPFVGPRPFQSGERLFGRLKETRELYYLLTAERIVWFHSPSGAGKTSLIWASLVPRLKRDGFTVCPCIRVSLDLPKIGGAGVSPSANRYLMSMMLSLEEGLPPDRRQSMESLAGQSLPDYLAGLLAEGGKDGNGTLLVFDQFEEILTVDPLHTDEKRVFFQTIGEALRDPSLWAVFALRQEYLAQLEPYIDWIPTRWSNTFRLDLLGDEAVREVVQRTAALAGRTFTDPAAKTLFADLSRTKVQQPDGRVLDEPGRFVEPVQLQVVCRRLWDAMPADDLTIDEKDLARFGDVSKALGAYYDDSVGRIGGRDLALERCIREWFGQHLITPTGIRGQVLRGADASEGLSNGIIEDLLDTHLVRGEQRAGATWYELAHDRLIQPVIDSNQAWLEANLQPFQRRAALWVKQRRPDDGGDHCLRGGELKEALCFQRDNPSLVSEDERQLLGISRTARARRLWTQAGLAFIAMVILVSGVTAFWLMREAQEKEREASYQTANVFWNNAMNERDGDPLKAAHYFARAAERFVEAESSKESANTLLALKFINDRPRLLTLKTFNPAAVAGPRFSTDGSRVLTWSADFTARVWDSRTGEAVTPPIRHAAAVEGGLFSADGSRVLTWSADFTARVWDSRTGEAVTPPLKHDAAVWGAQFSDDGSCILTFSKRGVLLWDSRTGEAVMPPFKLDVGYSSAQFSPDGSHVLTWRDDIARLWDNRTGKAVTLEHYERVVGGQFNADGSRVLTWTRFGTARLWDSRTGQAVMPPVKHEGDSMGQYRAGPRFTADGSRVLTLSADFTARVWDSRTGEAVTPPLKHAAAVEDGQFSPDGSRVLTWSDDRTAQIWDSRTGEAVTPPLKHAAAVEGGQFSADGSRVLTWSRDHSARLWDSHTGEAVTPPLKHDDWVSGGTLNADGSLVLTWSDETAQLWDSRTDETVIQSFKNAASAAGPWFSDDGSRVLTCSADFTARVWDSRTGQAVTPPLKHAAAVKGGLFSADGSRVLTWSADFTARVWDSRTGEAVTPPLKHDAAVWGANFSPDGSRVLTWSDDRTAQIWDSGTGQAVTPPFKNQIGNWGAKFSPDGSRIVILSDDLTAQLWDSHTGKTVTPALKHDAQVWGAQFSPDGTRVLTWSDDSTAKIWDSRTGKAITPPLKHGGSVAGAQFSVDGSRVLTWGRDHSAQLWDSHTGKTVTPALKHDAQVWGAQFSPDGTRVLTWSDDSTSKIWDSRTGEARTPPFKPSGTVAGAQFSVDGSRVLTWGQGTAQLWDSRTGKAITPPLKHGGTVAGAQFSVDGSRVLTWSMDGTTRTWDIAIDQKWPTDQLVLRTEVETGTKLTQSGELKVLSAAEWQRKRWCEYDAICHDLKRLTEADWAESRRLCYKAQEDARSGS